MKKTEKISVIGLGYVGIVMSVCLAELGYEIIGVDIDLQKVEKLKEGKPPIFERGLEEKLQKTKKQLSFTTSPEEAVCQTDICFVCVGTPSRKDGKVDLTYVRKAAEDIGKALRKKATYTLVVFRSTIPPGTSHRLIIPLLEKFSGKAAGKDFGYAFNPEFLREGSALEDFFDPPKTVIGCNNEKEAQILLKIYENIPKEKLVIPITEAELLKYVDNTWHALKIAFANEIGVLAKEFGTDGRRLMDIFCRDKKLNISPVYLTPGFAFGGSCLPKDVKGLIFMAKEKGIDLPLISHVIDSNWNHLRRAKQLINRVLPLAETIGVVGLAFKAGTNDVRESPAIYLARLLIDDGYQLRFFDPLVKPEDIERTFGREYLPLSPELFCKDLEDLFNQSSCLLLTGSFKDLPQSPELYRNKYVFDFQGVFYRQQEIKKVSRYYALCW